MGVYHYYLSHQFKTMMIDGKRERVYLYKFSHRIGSDAPPAHVKARLARNENLWNTKVKPRFVMHELGGTLYRCAYYTSHTGNFPCDWTERTPFCIAALNVDAAERGNITTLNSLLVPVFTDSKPHKQVWSPDQPDYRTPEFSSRVANARRLFGEGIVIETHEFSLNERFNQVQFFHFADENSRTVGRMMFPEAEVIPQWSEIY